MFKPEVPEKYDGKTHPSEFLSVYTIMMQAAGARDEKVLANYFPLVLKPNVRSWLMHLPIDSISSWSDICHEFVGAFTGDNVVPDQASDLHVIPQRDGECLRKYIQRFSRVQYNIPDVHPTVVISLFHQKVRNREMREELAMNKVADIAELYVMADRCTRAEEGRKYHGEDADVGSDSEDEDVTAPAKKGQRRNRKHKGKTVIAIEESGDPDTAKKAKVDDPSKEIAGCNACRALVAADKSEGSNKQYCKIHRTKGHDLQICRQVEQLMEKQRVEYERRDKEKGQGGAERSGKMRGGRGRRGDKEKQQERPAQGRNKKEEDDDDDDDDDSTEHEFQKETEVMCVDGGASLHSSHRQLK